MMTSSRVRSGIAGVLATCVAMTFLTTSCNDGNTVYVPVKPGWTIVTSDSSGIGWIWQIDEKTDTNWDGAVDGDDKFLRRLQGEFSDDIALDDTYVWQLEGGVFIGKDDASVHNTITIEAGTEIRGLAGSPPGMLVIRRGAKIHADGTAAEPIVFTSWNEPGYRQRGDWGGIVINGLATVNTPGGTAEGEGASGTYGGGATPNDDDDSGVLRYVRCEYAGHRFTADDELNGIAFQGVGNGTTVEYVQVHMNKDDGVEFYGGTVDAKYLLLPGCGDDSLDWTYGWSGRVQYVVIQQYSDDGDQGLECDNNGSQQNALPRAHPRLSNLTVIGAPTSTASDIGVLLRAGTRGEIYNSVFIGFNEAIIDIDDDATWRSAYGATPSTTLIPSTLAFAHNHIVSGAQVNTILGGSTTAVGTLYKLDGDSGVAGLDVDDFVETHNVGNDVTGTDPWIGGALCAGIFTTATAAVKVESPDFTVTAGPLVGRTVGTTTTNVNTIDTFFTNETFIGAMGAVDWLSDGASGRWTIHQSN